MPKIYRYCLLTILSLIICCHTDAQKKRSSTPHAVGEDIYKHYNGTIGKRQVTLDLRYGYQGASNYGGSSFYYADEERVHHFYISEPESFAHGVELAANEVTEDTSLVQDIYSSQNIPSPKWSFTISGKKLTGKWHSKDEKQTLDIDLTENYQASYPLDLFWVNDSIAVEDEHNNFPFIRFSFLGVTPDTAANPRDASFINAAQLKFLGISTWADYRKTYENQDRTDNNTTPKHHLKSIYLLPVYNDNGLLVLKMNGWDDYFTGKFSRSIISYLCIDVQNKKQLGLSDMLNVDTTKISALLEKQLRTKYKMSSRKPLGDLLGVDAIPVSRMVMPTGKGLIFSYNPDDILQPDEKNIFRDEIDIFIPYRELGDLLKPDFKKRVGL